MRSLLALWVAVVLSVTGAPAQAEEVNYYDLLSTDAVAARDFLKKHPEWDGRGTVVAVLDTGVDMSVPGLLKTSTGLVKVIEARDFTGQGTVHLREAQTADENGEKVWKTGKGVVRGVAALTPAPGNGRVLLGFLAEERFRNSAVSDINDNGRRREQFAVVAAEVEVEGGKEWAFWFDTDADGHVDDEERQEEYGLRQKHFFFRAQAGQGGRPPMAIALHFDAKRKELSLHFADGSHGTHVAGIATGFEIFGKKGFHGIAPGAQVLSLKIGDNTLSGGSTTTESMKRAIEFAGEWSREHNVPVVVNMSYGIGTEREGESDIDRITDQLLRRYPLLSVATSAGNSGPGLSTVGTPAGADLAFSTGALLTRANASSLYASKIARDVVFYFSSRGGELGKPDGLAPGCASATVPPWENWTVMRGTSMASPQAAGCLALLASAAAQSKDQVPVNGALLSRALRNSGRPLAGYGLADQGSGLVHVPDAWESYRSLLKRKHAELAVGFKVLGDCPTCPDSRARTAFLRAGTWLPERPDALGFSVSPIFATNSEAEQRDAYYEAFDLTVEGGDWLEPTASALFFNGQGSSDVDVLLRPEKLKKPGMHSALVRGTSRETGKGKKNGMFELWVTVIVPETFDLSRGFEREWDDVAQEPGELERYFVRVPEGAASMRVELSPAKGRFTQSKLTLFDPEGHEFGVDGPYADSTRSRTASSLVAKEELVPGIWEVVVMTHYVVRKSSRYDLKVSFSGFRYEAPEEFYYEQGSSPRAFFSVRSLFDRAFEGGGRGGLYGVYRRLEHTSKTERITFPIVLEKDVAQLKLKLRMDRDTYARFTDCAINILDDDGDAVQKGGFSSRTTVMEVANPKSGRGQTTYTVEIIGGFAERKEEPWSITVDEFYESNRYIPAKIWCDGYSLFTLYPNRTYACEFELQDQPPIAPAGFVYYGDIRLKNNRTGKNDLIIPLRMRVGD